MPPTAKEILATRKSLPVTRVRKEILQVWCLLHRSRLSRH